MAELSDHRLPFRHEFAVAFWLAADSIRAHKLRSFLTLLGVIVGVASVVLVGSAVEGLGAYAEQSTAKAFGTDTYLVAQIASTGRLSRREVFEKLRYNKRLREEDVEYLRATTGETTLYSSYRQRQGDVKRGGETLEAATIIGVSASLQEIRDVTLMDGRFFSETEERGRQYVAVIGDEVKEALFPGEGSPLGKTLKLSGMDFLVVGVQEKLGSAFGRSQDNSVYIPAPIFTRLYGNTQGLAIYGRPKADSGLVLEDSLDLTRSALRTRFHVSPGRPDKFDVLTPDAIRGFLDTMLSLIAAVVVPVTCISLVVGGIVIMNIMLVSVTERTREIGIRKSVGARRSDILLQVLIEAVLMASAGGLIGLAVGATLTILLSRAFEIQLTVTLPYVALAIGVSTIVGVASGWYPAARASRLDPIVALRSE